MTGRDEVRIAQGLMAVYRAEAEALGVSPGRLIGMDIYRYRQMADEALPHLTPEQWRLLAHVCDGLEALWGQAGHGDDPIPAAWIAAELMDWMRAGGSETEPVWARALYDQILQWPPLTVAGALLRVRAERATLADRHAAGAGLKDDES